MPLFTDRFDGAIASLAIKAPCRVATIANITLFGEQTVNGVAVVEGDRVLVKDQTAAVDNGIYEVQDTAWRRTKDFDGNRDAVQGTIVLVHPTDPGTLFYVLTTANPVVFGTSEITFEPTDPGVETVVEQLNDYQEDVANAADAAKGGWLVGWFHSFTGALGRTLGARSRDNLHLSDAGTTADMLTALNRIFAGYPAGFNCQAESGTWILSGTASFTGQRMTLKGMGRQHSIISFQPAGADVALEVNEPSAGGSNQGEISGFGFTGGANTQDKTAIRLVNVANYKISQIGISTGAWLGDSIGLKFEGRQFHHAQDCELACARPVVIGNNLTWPSLSGDHSVLQRMELIGTSATRPVIEFEDGTSFANMTLRNIAVVGGQHGIYWNDTTSTAAGFNLHIDGGRSEQGLDATAYSLYLASTAQTLQNLLVTNFKFGAERNGVYLRNVQRATFINCSFDSTTGTALNITLVAGSKLTLINCARPLAGAVTLTNARCVRRENVTGIGFIEEWVYDSGFNAGALVSDVYLGGTPFNVAVGATAAIADNTFTGFVMVTEAVENVSAVFHLTGTTQTTQEVLDPAGFFSNASGTASSNNIYWDAGSSRFAIRNNRAVQCTYSVLRLGTSA
jgi:hypothetical protein